ncbi:hypothetical protein ACZ11_21285 [Lysinibacillus xylanilyticus]|uniref:Glycosyltransferase 2-like domain-containing protein n=1 Tax=Lysinibacillus xylanilyticus TaxID=582475 RepID=A0A0K9F524_9BACI|nr:glycosyltransferase [Lysinibacillus xylanilyticus]KMY29625.1 hypothetical protein ACZ11_21285 [Lysinibacillus xylanilyticus]
MVKVSVIVPIYNSEIYLRRSIESIQNQTLEDIQIILVNDGSTDNSLSICKEYQKNDIRIEIIDKPNEGVSSSRNAGIEIAKGEYIGFIDPDDWIERGMYTNLYEQVKSSDAEVCIGNYLVENKGKVTPNLLNIKQNLLVGEEIVQLIIVNMIGSSNLNSNTSTIMGSVCRLIIKRDLISYNKLKFELGIPLMEDLIFCVQVLLKSKKVSINRDLYYHYMINSNSVTSSYRGGMINIQHEVYKILKKLLQSEIDINSIVEQRLQNRYVSMYILSIANEVRRGNVKEYSEKILYIKNLCKDKKLKAILKKVDMKGYTLRKKFVLTALKYELGVLLYIYYKLLLKLERR